MSCSFGSMSDPPDWRLLVDPPADGAWNMAVDEAILNAVAAGVAPPTLRFFQWRPACLSLGYFQPYAVVDGEACTASGVGVVRRPTGGRAILHDRELTYSVALPLATLGGDRGVEPTYFRLSQALLEGLRASGAWVTLARAEPEPGSGHSPACFDRASAHEILLEGRKVVGSAQVRRAGALLQHGSILFDPQVDALLQCLRLNPGERDRWQASMVKEIAGLEGHCECDPAALAGAIGSAFARVFGVRLRPAEATAQERAAALQLVRDKYGNPDWTARY